jgi:hypothetical protein
MMYLSQQNQISLSRVFLSNISTEVHRREDNANADLFFTGSTQIDDEDVKPLRCYTAFISAAVIDSSRQTGSGRNYGTL